MALIIYKYINIVTMLIRKVIEGNYEKRLRKKNKNKDFSIICPNCIGGLIYHRLGVKFLSPTINLWMYQYDYLKFVLDLEKYISLELEFIESNYNHPVAKLGDITIYFNHYKTNEEAKKKWNSRKRRINYDNLFLIMYDKDGLTKDDFKKLEKVKCRGKIVISNRKYKDIDYVIKIPANMDKIETRYRLNVNRFTGKRKFEEKFNYVKWLNK